MADFGAKVTKAGAEITSTDPSDYFLWSKHPLIKVFASGSFSMTVSFDSETTETISHNLGYEPFALVWLQRIDLSDTVETEYFLLDWSYEGATRQGHARAEVDTSDIKVKYQDNGHSSINSINGFYYIFIDDTNG